MGFEPINTIDGFNCYFYIQTNKKNKKSGKK